MSCCLASLWSLERVWCIHRNSSEAFFAIDIDERWYKACRYSEGLEITIEVLQDPGAGCWRIDTSHVKIGHRTGTSFLYDEVWEKLEGKKYRSIDIIFPILCVFNNRVTWYTKFQNYTSVHATYSLFESRVWWYNRKLKWTREELRPFAVELYVLKYWSWDYIKNHLYQECTQWSSTGLVSYWRKAVRLGTFRFWIHSLMNSLAFITRKHTQGYIGGDKVVSSRQLCWWKGHRAVRDLQFLLG